LKISSLRKVSQILGFISLNLGFTTILKTGILCPALYCYDCPLAIFACPIGTLQHFVALKTLPLYAGGTLGLFSSLLGRAYCSWFCPFGAFQEIISALNRKKRKLPSVPWIKFAVLAGVLALAYMTAETVFCRFCQSGSLFATLPYLITQSLNPIPLGVWIHFATLILVILAVFIFGKIWCRYLCPLGAVFGGFNKVSALSMKVDLSSCSGCKMCLNSCPMEIKDVNAIGSSTDCIRCGKCIEVCSRKAIRFSLS